MKKKIIYITSEVFGDNDAFFPILFMLADKGHDVRVFFQNHYSFEAIRASSAWWNLIRKFTRYQCLEFKGRFTLINKLVTYFRKFKALLSIIFNKGISFVPGTFTAPRVFQVIDFFRDLWHYRGVCLYDKDERIAILKDITPKQKKATDKPKRKKRGVVDVKNIVCLSRQQLESEEAMKYKNSLILPFPSMQKWWADFVKNNPPKYSNRKIDNAREIISVILLRKGNFYFREDSDVDILMDETVKVIRKYYPKTLIVLKPKFEFNKYWLNEKDVKERYQDDLITLSYDPVTLLALKTKFTVSTCQSSACYFMLQRGIPVIEYGRYSDTWREIFPRLTTIEDYGGKFIEDIHSLDAAIKDISHHRVDVDAFKKKIGYIDKNLDIELFR